MLWEAVRRLRHPSSGATLYDGLDMNALATGLCDVFVDNVKLVKARVEHSLYGTSSDNLLTGPHSSDLTVA